MKKDNKNEAVKNYFEIRTRSFQKNEIRLTDFDNANYLIGIDHLMQWIMAYQDDLFSINEDGSEIIFNDKRSSWVFYEIKPFIKYDSLRKEDEIISLLAKDISETFPLHRFNPYIELFFKYLNITLLTENDNYTYLYSYFFNNDRKTESLKKVVHIFNNFINVIRNEGNSKEFINVLKNYRRLQNKNTKSLKDYITKLFALHSRLLVIKIDLSYANDKYILKQDKREKCYLQVKLELKRLIKKMNKNPIFEHIVGYVWKLEYGLEKGFHIQFLIFFNGSMGFEDNKAKMIGDYWNTEITEGNGLYSHLGGMMDQNQGTVMINYDDAELLEWLEKAAEYITKPDYYMRLATPDKGRSFGKGEIKSKPSTN